MRSNDSSADAPRAFLRDRALTMVVNNLAPAPFLLVPFTVMVGRLLRDEASVSRLVTWNIVAAVCSLIIAAARWAYRRRPMAGSTSRWVGVLVGLSFAGIGTLFGMGPWIAEDRSIDAVLLFTLLPAVASAVGCIVTAGRWDMYAAFLVPVVALSTAAMFASDDGRVRALGWLASLFGVGLMVLHHVVSRGTLQTIRLQWRSDQLLRDLAHERGELTGVNEQLAATNRRLAHQATHDPLTGLYNRRGTLELLDQMLAETDEQHPVALLFFDLDRFKAVNDTLGHRGGDRFISIIADRLARSLEPGSVAGRMGGDEFVAVLPGHDMQAAAAVADRLVGMLAQPVYAEGRDVPSSVSIGVACAPQHGAQASELLRNANAALYRAKSAGRNRLALFDDDMQRELAVRLEGEQALRRGLDDGEIVPFFQPEIDALTGEVVGAELLARWVRRDGRVVAAQDFIELAQQSGLLERVTDRILAGARTDLRRFALLGLPEGFRFRINLAPEVTERSWRPDRMGQLLQGIDPAIVTVDLRESAFRGDLAAANRNLADFREQGGRVCLDDFARGVSSLSLLRRLPLDEVRIDRSSIDAITVHHHDRAIVRSVIALVRELGLTVTADGVETGLQSDALVALGCVRHQGHLYSEALPAAAFEDFLLASMAQRLRNAG